MVKRRSSRGERERLALKMMAKYNLGGQQQPARGKQNRTSSVILFRDGQQSKAGGRKSDQGQRVSDWRYAAKSVASKHGVHK